MKAQQTLRYDHELLVITFVRTYHSIIPGPPPYHIMAFPLRWDVVLSRCFAYQPEGHASYQPLTTQEIKLGPCVCFDDRGDRQPVNGQRWNFKSSSSVKKLNAGLGSGVGCGIILLLPVMHRQIMLIAARLSQLVEVPRFDTAQVS